ncbi:MAG: TRAP transporter small permease [Oscillospiraceae bacterium]|nr:TRAP transporter small permease [Oscillospiraceae bacterium]
MITHATLKRGVNRFSEGLYKVVEALTVLILLTVLIVVSLEVFMRYILNRGLPWILEIGTLGLQYLAFASMVLGVRYKQHISLLVVYNRFPEKGRKALDIFANVCTLLFGLAICFFGYQVTTQMWQFVLPATQWPQGLTYIICVFTGAIVAYESIVSLLGLNEKNIEWKAALSTPQKAPKLQTIEEKPGEPIEEKAEEEGEDVV